MKTPDYKEDYSVAVIVVVSWILTLINKFKCLQRQNRRDVAYAYKAAKEPIKVTKKVKWKLKNGWS